MTRRSVQIANELEKDILAGRLAADSVVDEVALAQRFGVSRTPVREALLHLSSSGLVRLEPGRGAVVIGISLQQVFDAYEVQATLSALAAELFAIRGTALQHAQMQGLHEQMRSLHEGEEQRETYSALVAQFHELIVQGCGNALLTQQLHQCSRILAPVRHASIMESHTTLAAMNDEHERVVAAILARDAEAAHRAMYEHLHLRGDMATRLVSTWGKLSQAA